MLTDKLMAAWALTTTALYTVMLGIPVIIIASFSKTGRIPYKLARLWSWLVVKTNRVKIRIEGREKLQAENSYIFMSNHASNLDPPVIAYTLEHTLRFVAKKSLTRIPVFGTAIRLARMIVIDRDDAQGAREAINRAMHELTGGISAFFFAEGTRSLDGKLKQFKKGGVMLALKTKLPIVPITIIGSYDLLPKNANRIKPGMVRVIISDPIDTKDYTEDDRDALLERVRSVISANLEKYGNA
ncbi:MAG: lysophospholipid acyltransferase family protein [Desulfomonilia bacterium]|jgi:1-acyl-sn-glycerol-3-phosphate acyltransferase